MKLTTFLIASLLFATALAARADVKLPVVIGSHMVLQREQPCPIWGWADPGEAVTVEFAGQKLATKAAADGTWSVKLRPMNANATPQTMTISGKNKLALEDVLVGEVWLCSGQSNMEWSVAQSDNPNEEIANGNHPLTTKGRPIYLIRAYFCNQGVGLDAGKWEEVSRLYRRWMGLALGRKPGRAEVSQAAKGLGQTTKNTAELLESENNETVLKDLGMAKMLRCRIRYFTAGAVIGSKEFVNEAFDSGRDRFGPKRKDGARAFKGRAGCAKGWLWSVRDLRKGIV